MNGEATQLVGSDDPSNENSWKITTEQTSVYLSVALMVAPNLVPRFSVLPVRGREPLYQYGSWRG